MTHNSMYDSIYKGPSYVEWAEQYIRYIKVNKNHIKNVKRCKDGMPKVYASKV